MTRVPLRFLVKLFLYLHRLVEEQSCNKRTLILKSNLNLASIMNNNNNNISPISKRVQWTVHLGSSHMHVHAVTRVHAVTPKLVICVMYLTSIFDGFF